MRLIQANKFYYPKGGAEQYVARLTSALTQKGHEVVPFAMQSEQNLPSPYAVFFPSFVPTEEVKLSFGAVWTIVRMFYSREVEQKMRQLLLRVQPKVVHVHNIYTQLSPAVLVASQKQRVPVVMTVHDHHLVSPQYNRWVDGAGLDVTRFSFVRAVASCFQKESVIASFLQVASFRFARWMGYYQRIVKTFFVPCEYMKQQMVGAGYDERRIVVNPIGIEWQGMTPRYDHDGYVLYVGRLSEEKGVETVLELAKACPDLSFRIVGTGPLEAGLRMKAQDLKNVTFEGRQSGETLAKLYQGARCVLVPSRVHEVYPLVVLEAQAYGKVVLASNAGGIPEQIEDGKTGLLLHPLHVQDWVVALRRVVADDAWRETMARAARAHVEAHAGFETHVARIEEEYRRVACG